MQLRAFANKEWAELLWTSLKLSCIYSIRYLEYTKNPWFSMSEQTRRAAKAEPSSRNACTSVKSQKQSSSRLTSASIPTFRIPPSFRKVPQVPLLLNHYSTHPHKTSTTAVLIHINPLKSVPDPCIKHPTKFSRCMPSQQSSH